VRILTYCALFILSLLPFEAQVETTPGPEFLKIRTVVIDAGHGGKDSGSLGSSSREKTIALNIALQVGNYIKTYMPDVKVIYTRDSDKFIPLYERADIANRNHAQVFISIHCNSLPPKKSNIKGTETYVMGLHNTDENLSVAKRENEVILLEDNYRKHYDGFDPNSPEAHIMLSMYQNAFMEQSILLAEKMEQQFKERAKRSSRGVKQAGFVVLKATAMPSVLVETGFLSNKEEEAYLNSEKGQVYLASAIYRAFREYKETMEKTAITKANDPETPKFKVEKVEIPETKASGNLVHYRVQLASSPVKLNTSAGVWKNVKNPEVFIVDNNYKYLSEACLSIKDAIDKQNFYRKNGFPDAFVVAYKGKEKISVAKAKELLGEN
jgi:N-acetylmuramoyl-L-alanine amidase